MNVFIKFIFNALNLRVTFGALVLIYIWGWGQFFWQQGGFLPDQISKLAFENSLLFLAAVGVLSATLVEILKSVLIPRALYHRMKIKSWLGKDKEAYKQLLVLAADKNELALMQTDTASLVGQIYVAIQIALANSTMYGDFARKITGSSYQQASDNNEAIQLAQNRLTVLQFSLMSNWAFWLQLMAFLMSTGLVYVILEDFGNGRLGYAIIGGILAPVARDLAVGIKGLRNYRNS